MIVQHTLQLLRYHRKLVLAIVALVTLSAAGLSVVRLITSPVYTASASVVVLPTEAEYAFGREASGGSRSTARALTATYMEYLRSRPVAEAALERVKATSGPKEEAAPLPAVLVWIKGTIGAARRIYRTLDSGKYVPTSDDERELKHLIAAIDLQKVADSYILKVQVNLENPEAAAAAANALAEAYVDRVSQQLATSAGQIGGFLQQKIADREKELADLQTQEEQLKSGLGISSFDEERQSLLASRDTARQNLVDAKAEVDVAETAMEALQDVDLAQSGRNLSELSQERSQASARLQGARRNVQLREQTIQQIDRSLAALRNKEEPLLAVYRGIELTKVELTELQSRLLTTNLTQSSAMAQVRVIDPAIAPTYPSSPRVIKNTAAGALASILLALFVVFVIDTLTGTVKTAADLERLVGSRCLATVPSALISRATRPSPDGPAANVEPPLRAVGAEIERGLAVLRAFEAPSIQITGFLLPPQLSDTAVTLGTALATQGHRVVCTLTDRIASADYTRKIAGDELRLVSPTSTADRAAARVSSDDEINIGDWARADSERQIRIKCLQPVSAELLLSDAASRSPVLVCVVPSGRIEERDVQDFEQKALEAGLGAVCFVLLTP